MMSNDDETRAEATLDLALLRDLAAGAPSGGGRASGLLRAADRIQEARAVLDAIAIGELLAALPADPACQTRHQTAISLLGAMEVLLADAADALDL